MTLTTVTLQRLGSRQLVDHFPLCMRHLHESLRADGHLKHNGRNQYGLFLKVRCEILATRCPAHAKPAATIFCRCVLVQGLGLSMQEALVFWRRAFQAKIPEDKFNKSYAYNIRYNYGQEGKRADFAPYRHVANCARSMCGVALELTSCNCRLPLRCPPVACASS